MGLLTGKVALVTGGGRGIGAGITQRFLEEGAQVLVAQRHPLPPGLASIGGAALAFHGCDLAEPEAAAAECVAAAEQAFGGLDILVNNAGMMFEKHIEETAAADWDRMMTVNVKAPFLLIKAALPALRRRGGGAVINIGSIEGLAANPGHAVYCASKSALHGMTRALATDLGRDRIRVNAIAPGYIETDLVADWTAGIEDRESFQRDVNRLHPVGRVGQPRDIGDMAVHLASAAAGFVTGQVLVVDGGRLAKLPLPAAIDKPIS